MRKLIVIAAFATLILNAAQADPEQALWSALKRALTSDNGDLYFETHVRNCELPRLKGVVTTAVMNEGVSKIALAMSDTDIPEVTLIVHQGNVKLRKPKPGSEIEFSGEAVDFTKGPFMLTFDVPIANVKELGRDH
jgi:hypothetical protein